MLFLAFLKSQPSSSIRVLLLITIVVNADGDFGGRNGHGDPVQSKDGGFELFFAFLSCYVKFIDQLDDCKNLFNL